MQFLSAGPKSELVDLSMYIAGNAPTVFGIVGPATRGKLNEATLVTSPNDFVRTFGEPLAQSYPALAAIETLKQGNQLWYVRVASSTSAKASYQILQSSTPFLTIEASTPGTWANSRLRIAISNVSGKEFKLSVIYDDNTVEIWDTTVDKSAANYVESYVSGSSEYINVTDLLDGASTAGPTEIASAPLTGGNDGVSDIKDADYIGTTGGAQIFRQSFYEIDVLACPGCTASVSAELISIAETRTDCLVLVDPPNNLSSADVLNWSNATGTYTTNPSFNSMHAAMYWPWITNYLDSYNGLKYDVPPSVFVLGQYAYNDKTANYWWAPAGLNRGRLTRAAGLKAVVDEGTMDTLYGGTNIVNPISQFPGDGVVIWGQRTTQRPLTATNRINVARLIMKVRRIVVKASRQLTFEQNDETTWNQWINAVDPFMAEIKSARGLYDYKVIMDASTVTPAHIDRLEMPGKVMVQPTRAAEFIPISFIITRTGVKLG